MTDFRCRSDAFLIVLLSTVFAAGSAPAGSDDDAINPSDSSAEYLTFPGGDGPGNGRHVVLIAGDQEYRSEESLPMLAEILSESHGFRCTVLFVVNDEGLVDPTLPAPFPKDERDKKDERAKRHRIPGLQQIAEADCLIWLTRFLQLADSDKKRFHDYFDSGKPILALRTANHGFYGGIPYQVNNRTISLRELLGGTFMGHHGGWHRESTRGIIIPEQRDHPILTGVTDIWGPSDVYRCHNERHPMPEDCRALVLGQPLENLSSDAPANADKRPLPIAWVKSWTGNAGHSSRIFHLTMGSARDFENEGVRRMTINAVFWGLGLEDQITADMSVAPRRPYTPRISGFNYEKLGVQPRPVSYFASP